MKIKSAKQEDIQFLYGPITDISSHNYYWGNQQYPKEEQADYHKLFKAIWEGNITEVENLTIKRPIGQQLHVCSKQNLFGWSSLYFAISKNNSAMVKRLIEIVKEQYTPPILDKQEEDDTPAINNYELVALMNNVNPKKLRRGAERRNKNLKNQNQLENPNLNCLTSLFSYLSYKDHNTRFNVLHCCAYSRSNTCLDEILTFIHDNKMKQKNQEGNEENLKDLLVDRGYKQFTPFELAIARGNVEGARKLLVAGGIDLPDLSEKNEYKGLDVGGKKMEWAFEHMGISFFNKKKNNKQKKKIINKKKKKIDRKVRYDRTAFHLSAAYGRQECIEFLKEEATILWNKLAVSSKVKDFNYFDPFTTDASGKTPLHWAIYNNNPKVIPSLLKIDNKRMLNSQDNTGLTPLHIAASSKQFVESLRVLVENGADLDLNENLSVTFIFSFIYFYLFLFFFYFSFPKRDTLLCILQFLKTTKKE